MSQPKVSLLCPAYNHERFVGFFIESVLKQTVQNWELIIVDDCSTDKTVAEIEKFSDPRIRLFKHEYNQGINAGLNDAFEQARGQYCVFIASDDMLLPNHLERSIGYLDDHTNVDVFYCSLSVINDDNDVMPDIEDVYVGHNRCRYELLEYIFLVGNCLLAPGMTARYTALRRIMPLPLGILQHQDTKMHVDLLLNGEVYQTTEKLVQYRRLAGDKNVSANTAIARQRTYLEESFLLDSFLKIKNGEFLKAIFKARLLSLGDPTVESIPYFLGRLALSSECASRKEWGYRVIMSFVNTREHQRLLYDRYGFSFKDYLSLADCPEFTEWRVHELSQRGEKQSVQVKKYRKAFKLTLLLIFLLVVIYIMQL